MRYGYLNHNYMHLIVTFWWRELKLVLICVNIQSEWSLLSDWQHKVSCMESEPSLLFIHPNLTLYILPHILSKLIYHTRQTFPYVLHTYIWSYIWHVNLIAYNMSFNKILLSLVLVATASLVADAKPATFLQDFRITWSDSHIRQLDGGRAIQLVLDQNSGTYIFLMF